MKILAVDIGTGTQDILLFDTRLSVENCYKLILPSPTLLISRKLSQATRDHVDVLLTGSLMGGGPNNWAANTHLQAGNRVYATPDAALSFNDDLEEVSRSGITLVSEDESRNLPGNVMVIKMRDFDYATIAAVFNDFGVDLSNLGAVSVAVFDHGNAPLDVSDRKFRFDYLDSRIRQENRLSAFAYAADQIPSSMTRLLSVARSSGEIPAPLVVMDTAPAAVLGTLYDPVAALHPRKMVLNIGNLHTLGFRLGESNIEGVFEHHTGLLDRLHLEEILLQFADGSLTNEDIFNHKGHGALVYSHEPLSMEYDDFNVIVTGPRRNLIAGSPLKPYFAVPYGDMMTAGCIGLIAATADILPNFKEEIEAALKNVHETRFAPWELDQGN